MTSKLSKKFLNEVMKKEKESENREIVLYLSKEVFNYKDLKATDIRLLIVLSSLNGSTVQDLRKFKNKLIPWITKKDFKYSKKILYNSLEILKKKGLVDKGGYGLDLKKDYLIFTENEFELLNKFKNISQLFMISARIWNRNKINQIVNVKYLNSFLPSNRRTEYFNNLIKALGMSKKEYKYFLDGNIFKLNLDDFTKTGKTSILSFHKKSTKDEIKEKLGEKSFKSKDKQVKEESDLFKELMRDKKEEDDEIDFLFDSPDKFPY